MQSNSILTGCAIAALLAGGVAVATPAMAQSAPTASSTSDTSSNGSSTGVGNAGSFGIGSGTSNGNATATATSNGAVDSHAVTTDTTNTDNHGDSHNVAFSGPVSLQTLTATVTGNATSVSGSYNTGSVMTGGVTFNGGAGAFGGVQTVSINSGVSSVNQAPTSLGTSGNVSFTH